MQTITLETRIAAPIERCFLLSLSIDLHTQSAHRTGELAVAGVTHGLIGMGESVTWRGRHFGVMLTQTSKITAYEPPTHFQDTMTRGLFRSFVHDHHFEQDGAGETIMRDILRFESPCGFIGRVIDRLILSRYLKAFLEQRNNGIRDVAESPASWSRYLALS